jgi:hypothetical protein
MDTRAGWDPWQDLSADLAPTWRGPLSGEYPPVNIITVVGDAVTIRGERKPEPGVAEERYHRRERSLGAFTRTVGFGEHLDADRVQASYANDILRLQPARAAEQMAR